MRDLISFVGKKPIEDHPTTREGGGEPRVGLQQGWGCSDDHQFKTRNSLVVFVLLAHRVIRGPIFAPVDIGEFKVPAEDSVEKGDEHFRPSETGKISYLCYFYEYEESMR